MTPSWELVFQTLSDLFILSVIQKKTTKGKAVLAIKVQTIVLQLNEYFVSAVCCVAKLTVSTPSLVYVTGEVQNSLMSDSKSFLLKSSFIYLFGFFLFVCLKKKNTDFECWKILSFSFDSGVPVQSHKAVGLPLCTHAVSWRLF